MYWLYLLNLYYSKTIPTFTTQKLSMTYTDLTVKMHGKVSVWPKSQIVIPKEVRDLLDIKPGDDLMIISKWDMAIGMIKSDDVQKFLQYVHAEIKQ